MKKFAVIAIAFGLAACSATPQEEAADMAYTQGKLPTGCKLGYAGSVKLSGEYHSSRIFYVNCNGVVAVSETHTVPQGKTSYEQTDVIVSK